MAWKTRVAGQWLQIIVKQIYEKFRSICWKILELRGHIFNVNIIWVYAPTEDKSDEETEELYPHVDEIMSGTNNKGINILMGDFNAKIEKEDWET